MPWMLALRDGSNLSLQVPSEWSWSDFFPTLTIRRRRFWASVRVAREHPQPNRDPTDRAGSSSQSMVPKPSTSKLSSSMSATTSAPFSAAKSGSK